MSCVLCPNEGGAFKQTTQGKWAHLLCAMWIAETGVSNPVYMEPIDSVERIPKTRWALRCYLCKKGPGACIQCSHKACGTAFHVTCARKAGLLLKTERQRAAHSHDSDDEDEVGDVLKALCHKHLPKRLRQAKTNRPALAGAADGDDTSTRGSTPVLPTIKPASRKITIRRGANGVISAVAASPPTTQKSARAYKKSYKAGPPLVPSYVIDRVLEYVARIPIRKRQPLILQIARFWSLKREARRGAALLKRLHLEPWTATSGAKELTESERIKKLQFVCSLREDLERLRMLAELVRKREREKLRQVDLIRQNLVDGVFFPMHSALQEAFNAITSLDRNELFANPVSRSDVPDYYEVIKKPMDWATVSVRIKEQIYATTQEFADDINLVLRNAMTYNKPDTPFHRAAARIQKAAEPILQNLTSAESVHRLEALSAGGDDAAAARNAEELQLEPPYSSLQLLEDYSDERRAFTIAEGEPIDDAPSNLIRDLLRQYPKQERAPPRSKQPAASRKQVKKRAPPPRARTREALASEPSSKLVPASDPQDEEAGPSMRVDAEMRGQETSAAATSATATSETEVLGERATNVQPLPTRARARTADSRAAHSLRTGADAGDEEALATPSRTRSATDSRTKKSEAALSTGELNDWDTFKRFEQGWILPEGSRRKGRGQRIEEPTRPAPSPTPRQRSPAKTAAQLKAATQPTTPRSLPKRRSLTYGSIQRKPPARRAPTAPKAVPDSSELSDLSDLSELSGGDEEMEDGTASASAATTKPAVTSHEPTSPQPESSAAGPSTTRPMGSDELTPLRRAPRSSSQYGSSAARLARAGTTPPGSEHTSTRRKRAATESPVDERLPKARAVAGGSSATPSRSEAPSSEAGTVDAGESVGRNASASQSPAHSRTQASPKRQKVYTTTAVEQWPPGTFVWAYLKGCPWYPGQVLFHSASETMSQPAELRRLGVAQSVVKMYRGPAKRCLVRWFDEGRTHGWILAQDLQRLFENDEGDAKMLASIKKRHGPSVSADVVAAFKSAKEAFKSKGATL